MSRMSRRFNQKLEILAAHTETQMALSLTITEKLNRACHSF